MARDSSVIWQPLALALAAWAAAPACGGPAEAFTLPGAAAPRASDERGELGLFPGEAMAFEVRLAGVAVGEAGLAVGTIGDFEGAPAITVHSKISTTGAVRLLRPVDDEATTIIDAATGAPKKLSTHVLLGGQETFTEATFAGGKAAIQVRRAGETTARSYSFAFDDAPAHDAHSAMAELRGWRADKGARRTVWLVGGRRLWRIDLTYGGVEQLGTVMGNRAAARIDGVGYRANPDRSLDESRPPRKFSVWMSQDADRLPLRVAATTELGDVQIDLSDYQRP